MSALKADPTVVTENIRKEWNGWNYQQRTMWLILHELPLLPLGTSWEFDDLPPNVKDALFCEFLDNVDKDFE